VSPTRVTVNVSGVRAVVLGGRRPTLALSVHVSRAANLVVTLGDSRGRPLATWKTRVKSGTHRLSFVLPPKARHAGRDQLRLTWPGGHSKTIALTVRKPRSRAAG
jgi:hypothetical protein